MRFKRLKKAALSVACGALLLSGSGVCDLKVSAEEMKSVYEEDTDVIDSAECDSVDATESVEELEENENIYGITAALDKSRELNPGTAGLSWLWPNDFYTSKSVKKIKSGTYYNNGEENTKYPGHADYEYNDKGQLIRCLYTVNVGEWGSVIEYDYYDNGDIKSFTYYKLDDAGNPVLESKSEFEYEYDAAGKCIKEKYYYTDYSDSAEEWKGKRYLWSTSTYEYDANGNCIKENDDYYDVIKLYEYDAYGNCIKKSTQNEAGYIERVDEYNAEGYVTKETHYDSNGNSTIGAVNEYKYEYDADGDVVKITKTMHYLDDDKLFTGVFKYDYYPSGSYSGTLSTSGIYCASTSPSIVAGMVTETSNANDIVEYQWLVCDESTGTWSVASDWTRNNEYMNYTPFVSGNYIFLCKARIAGNPTSEISASFGTPFTKTGGIKQICQMPYWGEGGGYLIGFESFENPNQEYQYEMFVMDLSLLAAGSPTPWVHATGKIKLAAGATPEEGKTMWTIWQPEYGYYLTLFRLYDKDGNMIDEVPYGFANAY